MKAELRDATRRRRLTAWRLIAVNVAVIGLNVALAVRGVLIWSIISRFGVVTWIKRANPHVLVTLQTMRLLNWATLPIRTVSWPFLEIARAFRRRPGGAAALTTQYSA